MLLKVNFGLHGYVDADITRDIDDRKSTTKFIYTLSDTASWVSKL